MKIIFINSFPRVVQYVENREVKEEALPFFLPPIRELQESLKKATIAFYEPFIPLFRIPEFDYSLSGCEVLHTLEELASFTSDKTEDTVFLDFSGCRSIPEFLYFFDRTFSENEVYAFLNPRKFGPRTELDNLDSQPKDYSLSDVVDLKPEVFAACFNPFSEFKMNFESWSGVEREHNFEFLFQLFEITRTYIDLGFDSNKINPDVDLKMWTCNQEISVLRALRKYFEFEPAFEYRRDIPQDDFCERQEYRFLITDYLKKVCAHIGVANKFVSRNSDWSDSRVYKNILEKIRNLK